MERICYIITQNGTVYLPQTYAIDYILIRGSIDRFAKELYNWRMIFILSKK